MHDNASHAILSVPELRKFGFLFGGIVVILFGLTLPYLRDIPSPTWPWVVSGTFATCALLFPSRLRSVYHLWMKIGSVLGWINTRIILAILFYVIFMPIGLWMRLTGKDPLARRFNSNVNSYRIIAKPISKQDFERPF